MRHKNRNDIINQTALSDIYDNFNCPLCDKRGLVSMIEVKTANRVHSGRIEYTSKYKLWTIEDEISMRESLEPNQMLYKSSASCGCERGKAYFDARDSKPAILNPTQYQKCLAKI